MAAKRKAKKKRKGVKKRPTGRPTLRTEALVERLLAHLETGGTVSGFCREPGTPTTRTIERWADQDTDLLSEIARARARGCDALEEEFGTVAKSRDTEDPDDVQHRRLQLFALEKRMTWNNPAKYGQKTQLDVNDQQEKPEMTDLERAIRIRQILERAGMKVVEVEIGEPQDAVEGDDR